MLTDNEARVVWSILSGGLQSEEDRIRESGVPRTTYHSAKLRLYSEGLLEDRYVPNPDAIGVPRVSFLLSRPPAEKASTVFETLSKIPGTVEAWAGTQVAFAVIFHKSVEASDSFLGKISSGELGDPRAIISADTAKQQVPVYFDFEGTWARYCGSSATKRYPCPLPPPRQESSTRGDPSRGSSSSIASLLTRHFTRPSHLIGPASVPKSQRRSLQQGRVEWRVFLGFPCLNTMRYRGLTLQDLVFIAGKLKDPDGMAKLLPDLATNCNVRPFLMVGDDDSVLIASLGIGLRALDGAPADARPRHSVIQVLAQHLKDIEVIREPLASLRMPVAHRFDILV
jgi:hypothetical protein